MEEKHNDRPQDNHRSKDEKIVNEMIGDKKVVIGIDFGTSDSCVSVCKEECLNTIANEKGERSIPSCVAFTLEGKVLVGHAAQSQLTIKPENTIQYVKRLMGMNFDDKALQNEIKHLPFEVVNKNNKPCIRIKTKSDKKEFYPEEISAMIFKELKETAERYLGKEVTHAVVTVPASFNPRQRQAIIDAGSIARLNVRILNESIATVVGLYGNKNDSKKSILVFRMGAGSFEVTVLKKNQNDYKVIATGGNTNVGGIAFNRRVMDYFVDIYRRNRGINIGDDKCFMQELQRRVKRAILTLSLFPTVNGVAVKSPGDKFELGVLTRAKFEELNEDLFQLTIDTTQDVLDSANMTKNDIDEIILTGCSTETPKIRKIVNNFFECKQPVHVSKESPSLGTAKLASTLYGEEELKPVVVSDVIAHSLGIRLFRGFMGVIIPRNTSIPVKKLEMFTSVYDNQDEIFIKVYEGEHEIIEKNQFLDEFTLLDIEVAPKGVPEIEVTMEINVNGILLVSARDLTTKSENNIVINSFRKRFEQSEIEQMVQNIKHA